MTSTFWRIVNLCTICQLFIFSQCAYRQQEDNLVTVQLDLPGEKPYNAEVSLHKYTEEYKRIPRSMSDQGQINFVDFEDWTSGFYAGNLWNAYALTGNEIFKKRAITFTDLAAPASQLHNTHDLGFMIYCSAGLAYKHTGEERYKDLILQASDNLVDRFNPKVGCIRSWDFGPWEYPVIIDNMMNLEMLFEATKLSGDSIYYKVAETHALTTMKNHFRDDFSSYHLLNYDTITGLVKTKGTFQGKSDESSWARGQGWGLYGFTMCFRETGNPAFLVQAKNIAKLFMERTEKIEGQIPFWDFSVEHSASEPRDVSAASLAASGLYDLSLLSDSNNDEYFVFADKMMKSLFQKPYLVDDANHPFLLDQSTGHKPEGTEVGVPIVYADFYFLEALLKRSKIRT